jgi:CheY-like chemotaxis protein
LFLGASSDGELNPDVAIIDVAMPRLNGLEAATKLLEREANWRPYPQYVLRRGIPRARRHRGRPRVSLEGFGRA